jgi:hypothetical protein
MTAITGDQVMICERFVPVLSSLRWYDNHSHIIIMNSTSSWIDQMNTLDYWHALENKIFERALGFFLDDYIGCYVLDDELIGSKAADIKSKVITDRKAAGEGPVYNAICDSFFQIILGMRFCTISDSQQQNLEKLLDLLRSIGNNELSVNGLMMACDRSYGKLPVAELLARKKVVTICHAVGSQHPILLVLLL